MNLKRLAEFPLVVLFGVVSVSGLILALAAPQLVLPIGWTFFLAGSVLVLADFYFVSLQRAREREANLAREIQTREAELKNLWQASLDVADAPDYTHVLRAVVERARELIGAEASALCLWDEQKNWWVLQGTSGADDAFEVTVNRLSPRDGMQVVECPVIRFKYRRAHLDVPVMRGDQVLGCLCVANQDAREFSPRERELIIGIADQAARALDHARRLENIGTQAATRERELMSRELHDTVAQLLGFVGFKTEAVRELLAHGQREEAEKQLVQLAALAQELYAETREIILGLRNEITPDRDLLDTLRDYVQHFSEFSGVPTTLETRNFDHVSFTPATEVQLVRVVQEALSNVRKHARAKAARVSFERVNEFARIKIEDDGQGFDPTHVRRGAFPQFGLQSMRERVETVGGTFVLDSIKGEGTTVTIRIPLVQRGA